MVFRAENAGRTPSQNRFEPAYLALHRRGDLQVRVEQARRELAECHICPRLCEVDRLAGQMGVCKIDRHARVASYFPHFGEEDCLRGWAGSGFTDDIAAPNSFSLDDGGTKTFLDVLAGSYTITEDDPGPGYTLTALACVDPSGGTSVSLFTRMASIDLAVGETVECTFTNTASASAAVTVRNLPPALGLIAAPLDPVALGDQPIEVTGVFTDPGALDTHTAVWTWGDGSTSTGTVRV